MSTTTDLSVAVCYGQSPRSLVFKIVTKGFMTRGADIGFLSAFPSEHEYLFPPLTYLQPTDRPSELVRVTPKGESEPLEFRVVEVEPVMS